MSKSTNDRFNKLKERNRAVIGLNEKEKWKTSPFQGEIFLEMRHNDGRVETQTFKNIITDSASILLARLIKDNSEPTNGAFALAVGTGGIGEDPQNPTPATAAQTALEAELFRKQFQSVNFINAGVVTGTPTNVIDLTTFFTESEAVGALLEMGIVGGDATLTSGTGTLINYRTFPVINKPATATLSITWRFTF